MTGFLPCSIHLPYCYGHRGSAAHQPLSDSGASPCHPPKLKGSLVSLRSGAQPWTAWFVVLSCRWVHSRCYGSLQGGFNSTKGAQYSIHSTGWANSNNQRPACPAAMPACQPASQCCKCYRPTHVGTIRTLRNSRVREREQRRIISASLCRLRKTALRRIKFQYKL